MKFSKDKCCIEGRTAKYIHTQREGLAELQSEKKDVGVLVDHKLHWSQCSIAEKV